MDTIISNAVEAAASHIPGVVKDMLLDYVTAAHESTSQGLHVLSDDGRISMPITLEELDRLLPHDLRETARDIYDAGIEDILAGLEDPAWSVAVGGFTTHLHDTIDDAVADCKNAGLPLTSELLFNVFCGVMVKLDKDNPPRELFVWSNTPEQNDQWSDILMRYVMGKNILTAVLSDKTMQEDVYDLMSILCRDIVDDNDNELYNAYLGD